ncbi:hypothetical protein [Streptomyces sp. NPDC101145]|uniref:hypothetical protein n=1 Tax=Streptomyces sp. NPDC101145 TaxID=3366112 RepID=UPI0038230E45
MSRRIGRGGRKGQTHTATPTLRSYDIPPASKVTITRADGTVEVVPAVKPKTVPKPNRRTRAKRSPVVCAMCGQPIKGEPLRSTERWTRGKPVHPAGACPKKTPKAPTKPTPTSALHRPRGSTDNADEDPNTGAVELAVGQHKGTEMDRRSWYMPKQTADALAEVVEELHFETRQPKYVVLSELIAMALEQHEAAVQRLHEKQPSRRPIVRPWSA